MNVLSLFDGISCGQIALNRAKIKYDNYFASEIDKHTIKVTQHNYPNTIQLGDVCKVNTNSLPKIDLLIGGSPCQGFSFAGKQLNFIHPQSRLFFEFVRIKNALQKDNPELLFLLENVKMKQQFQDIISDYIGVQPIEIDSKLVSAQSRKRLYWTNIPNIQIPIDKNILLKDIIEYGNVDRDKSYCIDANYYKGGNLKQYFEKCRRQLVFIEEVKGAALRNQVTKDGIEPQLNVRKDSKSNCIVPSYPQKLNGVVENKCYRPLTPVECERLQTIPDNYTSILSNTQRYKVIGNGWTVDVIAHIFKNISND